MTSLLWSDTALVTPDTAPSEVAGETGTTLGYSDTPYLHQAPLLADEGEEKTRVY